MSTFGAAISHVFENEGGYVNDPSDRGGETKFGISKKSYPKLDIANLTKQQAMGIYKRDYWLPAGYSRLHDQRIATKVFDLAVNMGPKQAHKLLQRALKAVKTPVIEDGVLGPITREKVNLASGAQLIAALRSEAAGHYRLLASLRPENIRFLSGWLRRAYQ